MLSLRPTLFATVAMIFSLGAGSAAAADIDVAADIMTRDPYGVVTAEGDVVIRRDDETLKADKVLYDASRQQFDAIGNVILESPKATITADSGQLKTDSKTGSLQNVQVTLKDGSRLKAGNIERLSDDVIKAKDASFTACPPDAETWVMKAGEATLDQGDGTLTARHARFEVAGLPLLYTPYWQQALRRKSGFLMPFVSTSKTRGTETALPYYFAPDANWDATLTPHWMTARGFKGEIELRHASVAGYEQLQFEGLRDEITGRQRNRSRAKIREALPYDINFIVDADHVSDHNYLADFALEGDAISSSYLQSEAALSQHFDLGDWLLMARHQQNLSLPSNDATLQILPRFESGLHLPIMASGATLNLEQQSTQFSRQLGVDGWRVDLNPYLEIPWQLSGGGMQSTLQLGSRHTRYWLKDTAGPTILTRNTFEVSLDNRLYFERISDHRDWRHTLTPILRYDFIAAPNQSALPNFDSSFGKLSMNNLLTGNRFTGRDRIERLSRISAMIETGLQHKAAADAPAHTYLEAKVGAAYELKRESVDAALLAAPTRPFSNLLGEIGIHPTANIHLAASGQYDPAGKYWAIARSALNMASEYGHHLNVGWQRTDGRYATASELATADAAIRVAQRWSLFGTWQYDLRLKLTQQASSGVHYLHPCWDLRFEGYRNQLNGTTTTADYGFRFLLGFKGLGSVGS